MHPLEPGRQASMTLALDALDQLVRFTELLPKAPADGTRLREDEGSWVAPPEQPRDHRRVLDDIFAAAEIAVETAGPTYMGYVPGGGLVSAAVADLVADGLNRYTGMARFAPALVAMEESVLSWLGQVFGLPASGGGLTTTGGSMANLTAVVAARESHLGEEFGKGTIYLTAATHRSVAKAARVAGVARDRVRTVPTTDDLHMDVAAAAEMIHRDRSVGLTPFLLVGTAGTTDTGAVDPLAELGELARAEGLWFHADGAYGGFFQLTERGRQRLAGIELADSITLDPHKGMFLPYGTGVLLVRDRSALQAAFAADGNYLQDVAEEAALPDYASLGPELSREFRGLRLWLPLQLHGVAAFREALDEKLDLALQAHRELDDDPRLEVPWAPELSTVAFRLRDEGPDGARTKALLERVNATNRVFLSSTRIGDHHHIRLCILSHRTHAAHVSEAIEIIRSQVHHP